MRPNLCINAIWIIESGNESAMQISARSRLWGQISERACIFFPFFFEVIELVSWLGILVLDEWRLWLASDGATFEYGLWGVGSYGKFMWKRKMWDGFLSRIEGVEIGRKGLMGIPSDGEWKSLFIWCNYFWKLLDTVDIFNIVFVAWMKHFRIVSKVLFIWLVSQCYQNVVVWSW